MRLLSPAYIVGGLLLSGGMTVGLASAGAADAEVAVCNGLPVTIDLNTASGTAATEGADVILGTPGDDTINGLGGDDTICGGEGDDRLFGEDGDDTLVGDAGNDSIGDGVIEACDAGEDAYLGGDGDDSLYVNCASLSQHTQVIRPGAGNDLVTWPYAGDEFGSDSNYLSYADVAGPVQIDLNPVEVEGRMVVKVTGGAGTDVIRAAREGVAPRVRFVVGSQGDDTIIGTDLTAAPDSWKAVEELHGGRGADTIHGGAGRDFLSGDAGADRLYGDAGGDVLDENGLGDGDAFDGDVADDQLVGGAGDDKAYVGMGDDVIDLGGGQDEITYAHSPVAATVSLATTTAQDTGLGRDTISGTEIVTGSRFADTLTAGIGASTLVGNDGMDQLDGGPGDDTFKDGDASVSYAAAPGPITMTPSSIAGRKTTVSGQGTDTFEKSAASGAGWSLVGSAHDDTIEAGFFCEVTGAAGDDRLVPGARSAECDEYAISGGEDDDILEFQRLERYLDFWSSRFDGGPGIDMVSFVQWSSVDYTVPPGADGVIGSPGPDRLTGDARANRIEGGAGDDIVRAGAGDDAVDLGTGNDSVYAGDGNDDVKAGSGNDDIHGEAGDDRLDVGAGVDKVSAGAGNDTIAGAPVAGGEYGDEVFGGSGRDTVTYAAAKAGARAWMPGDHYRQTVDHLTEIETVVGSRYADDLRGGSTAEAISGGAGNDHIEGLGGTDVLTGGDGNDTIDPGAGNDTVVGSAGADTVAYGSASRWGVRVTLATTASQNTVGSGYDRISSIENLTGSSAKDVLAGSSAGNVINGLHGNDTISGGPGTDKLHGGPGIDTVTYASAGGRVTASLSRATGGAGTDTLGSVENLIGSRYADRLTGNAGANSLWGGPGNDVLFADAGPDKIVGGLGVDTYSFVRAKGRVTATMRGSSGRGVGSDRLHGLENLTGGRYDDKLQGNGARNVIRGGAGRDLIYGYGGKDRLFGNAGPDQLRGGAGWDRGNGGLGRDVGYSIERRVSIP